MKSVRSSGARHGYQGERLAVREICEEAGAVTQILAHGIGGDCI